MAAVTRSLAVLVACLVLAACASFAPNPRPDADFMQRAETQERAGLRVSVSVPTRSESRGYLGIDVEAHGVQPVWVRVVNTGSREYLLYPVSMDPDYFSAAEVAWKSHLFLRRGANRRMDALFDDQQVPVVIPGGETVSGFVYTNLTLGLKYLEVDLRTEGEAHRFDFTVELSDAELDYHQVDFDNLYAEDEIREVDEAGLRAALEALPCCVLGGDRKTLGDPMNIVVVAPTELFAQPFLRRRWDVTETIRTSTVLGTALSSVFGRAYKNSPVSALYVFDRPQDVALQKARDSVDERNHLRLWLSPLRFEGMDVWVGQISRDIGVRLSSKTLVTHKIDPDVDDARFYLLQDLANSGGLAGLAYVKGVGAASRNAPRYNYTGDAYYTDGLRHVYFFGADHVNVEELDYLDWEDPADYDDLRTAPVAGAE